MQSTSDETRFLHDQAEHAKLAIARVAEEMGKDLADGVDPRQWTRTYPWASLGAAAMGGLFAGMLLIPSREQQALKHLQRIERALHPEWEKESTNHVGPQERKKGNRLARLALAQTLRVIKPMLASIIAGFVSARVASPAEVRDASAEPVTSERNPDETDI